MSRWRKLLVLFGGLAALTGGFAALFWSCAGSDDDLDYALAPRNRRIARS